MKNKIKRDFWKRITTRLFLIVIPISIVFGVSLNFINKSKKDDNYSLKLVKRYAKSATPLNQGGSFGKVPIYTPPKSSQAPESLYLINVPGAGVKNIDFSSNAKDVQDYIQPIKEGFKNLKFSQATYDEFLSKERYLYFVSDSRLSQWFQSEITDAISFFADIKNVISRFNKFNGIGNSSKSELNIYPPTGIYDVFEASKNNSQWDKTSTLANNIQYKIGEVDIDKNDKVFNFSITDEADPDFANHDFHLIMNNTNKGLTNLLNKKISQTATGDIEDAINKGKIILRDYKEPYDPSKSSLKKFIDKISLYYNNDSKKIEIIAKNINNNNENNPLKFKANDNDTKKFSKLGFLDVNLSPKYNAINYLKTIPGLKNSNKMFNWPEKKPNSGTPEKYQMASSYIKIHRSQVKQSDSVAKGEKEFSFWLAQDESIDFSVGYKDDPNALKTTNIVKYSYDGAKFSVTPLLMNLNVKSKIPPNNQKVNYSYFKETISGIKYVKVKIKVSDRLIINDELLIKVPKPEKRIFFEYPSNDLNIHEDGTIVESKSTKIENPTKINTNKDEYIKSVIGNWYDLMSKNSGKQWILPHQSQDKTYGKNRIFNFNYEFYVENSKNGIVKVEGGTKDGFLKVMNNNDNENYFNKILMHDKKTFQPIKDSKLRIYKKNVASGENLSKLLSDYFNLLSGWASNKFQVVNVLKSKDFYKPIDQNDLGRMLKKIRENAPNSYDKLLTKLNALLKLATEGYNKVADEDKNYIDSIDNFIPKAKEKINYKIKFDPKTEDPIWNQDSIAANQLIMVLVEKELVPVIDEIIKNENKIFEEIYSSLLGKSMSIYLDGSGQGYNAISKDALKVISDSKLSDNFKGKQLIAVLGSSKMNVNSGKAQLKSLLDFIHHFSLEKRYLDGANISLFDTHYKSGDIINKDSYTKAENRSAIGGMVGVIDEIIKKILKNDKDIESISNITKKIEQGIILDKEGAAAIRDSINKTIEKITSSEKGVKYKLLSKKYTSSYIDNLVLGRNLTTILDKWVEINKNKINKKTIEELKQAGLYNPSSLVNLSLSFGYYNFKYFISALTDEKMIPKTADEMLKSDFNKNIFFEIPKSNPVIDVVSDPLLMSKYGIISSGTLLSLIGVLSFMVSMLISSKRNVSSRRSSITMKILFMGISIIGMVLTGLGAVLV